VKRYLFAAAMLALALPALADTTVIDVPGSGVDCKRGNFVIKQDMVDAAACRAFAIADAEARKASANYWSAPNQSRFAITYKAPPPVTPLVWVDACAEGGSFVLTKPAAARYGKAPTWDIKALPAGPVECTNAAWGSDPLPEVEKVLQVADASAIAGPLVAPWDDAEGNPLIHWVHTMSGTCTNGTRLMHMAREREMLRALQVGETTPELKQEKDEPEACGTASTIIPAPPSGFGSLTDTVGGMPGDYGGIFREDGVGAFRITCRYSHMSFDDPVVFPGREKASHLHVFFGNGGTNAHSTATTIRDSGPSTCAGGTVNRSSYWVPAMVDQRTGKAKSPTHIGVYYKSFNGGGSAGSIAIRQSVTLPAGLAFVFGNKMDQTTKITPWYSHGGEFYCRDMTNGGEHYINADGDEQGIPTCRVGDEMNMNVYGPRCWDGVNLDSPDHRSHVLRVVEDDPCPVSHPANIPVFTYIVTYQVEEGDDTSQWRLSSDPAASTGVRAGYTVHGDYWEGWQRSWFDKVLDTCIRVGKDCHQDLIGNGQQLLLQ
jgi:uncharacterized protein DUF1996